MYLEPSQTSLMKVFLPYTCYNSTNKQQIHNNKDLENTNAFTHCDKTSLAGSLIWSKQQNVTNPSRYFGSYMILIAHQKVY